MRTLFAAGDSDSQPDANAKPLDSLGDAAAAHGDAGAGADEAHLLDGTPGVVQHSAKASAPAMDPVLAPQSLMLQPQPLPPLLTPETAAGMPAAPVHVLAAHRHVQRNTCSFDFVEDSEDDEVDADDPCAGKHVMESESEDSDFEHGSVVRELRSGRHSKLEGSFFGNEQVGALTLHTKFEAAAGASKGYNKTLERGMAVDAEGCPEDTWLVRIIGGSVAGSRKGKPQRRYVALLHSDYDSTANEIRDAWYYAPLQNVTPLGPIEICGKVACDSRGKPKLSFNCGRHAADKALAKRVPQSINTLSPKAGELTPRVPRAEKRARSK